MKGKRKRDSAKRTADAEVALARMGYAYYRKAQVEKFKHALTAEDIAVLREESKREFCRRDDVPDFYFDSWLIEKGCVPVVGFEEWREGL